MERRILAWAFLGQVGYDEATALQRELREALRRREGPEHLLLLEHPHVFTLGRNAAARDVLAPAEWLAEQRVAVRETDRGGQVTYHGPGQLVGYPILDLNPDRRDLRRYVRDLEEVLIRTLGDYGIAAQRRAGQEHIGVWVGARKIAAIGVHLSRWLTTHGFALNVTTDLSFFGRIVPCGLHGLEVASIESLTGEQPALAEVARRCLAHFAEVFDREPVAATALTAPAEVTEGAAEPWLSGF